MSVITLSHPKKNISGAITLPGSKSITNRLLIMQALSGNNLQIENLSEADDSKLMQQYTGILNGVVNIENAGTCMRFLTAYYSLMAEDILLMGNERMHQRPIKPLVDALNSLGASIAYVNAPGYPPLRIKGKKLSGGGVKIDASISSQFISALMLIGPLLNNGLIIETDENVVSKAYNMLTLELMRKYGIQAEYDNNRYVIHPGSYQLSNLVCEPDWSAASYFYSICSLTKEATLFLNGLHKNDIQPDKHIYELMNTLGVNSQFFSDGVRIDSFGISSNLNALNMSDYPDLVPTLAVLSAGKNRETVFTQIGHLQFKETNRLEALTVELTKCGFNVSHDDTSMHIMHSNANFDLYPKIKTYGDHRMAMSFAPLALVFDKIDIENPEVVEKSFPNFWKELKNIGFIIEQN